MDADEEWIDITHLGTSYEIHMDLRAPDGNPRQYRHRPYRPRHGETAAEERWVVGLPDAG